MTTKSFPLAAARGLAMQRAWASDHSRKAFALTSAKAVQFFGPLKPVTEIGPKQIEAWEEAMVSENLAEATIDRCKGALLSCLLAAHRAGHAIGQFQNTVRALRDGEALRQYRAEAWRRTNDRLMQRRIDAWQKAIAAEGQPTGATTSRRAGFANTVIAAYRAGLLERIPPVMDEGAALDKRMGRIYRLIGQRLKKREATSN